MAVALPHPKQSSMRSARIGGLCRQTRVTNALAGCAATRSVGMDRMAATPAAMGLAPASVLATRVLKVIRSVPATRVVKVIRSDLATGAGADRRRVVDSNALPTPLPTSWLCRVAAWRVQETSPSSLAPVTISRLGAGLSPATFSRSRARQGKTCRLQFAVVLLGRQRSACAKANIAVRDHHTRQGYFGHARVASAQERSGQSRVLPLMKVRVWS